MQKFIRSAFLSSSIIKGVFTQKKMILLYPRIQTFKAIQYFSVQTNPPEKKDFSDFKQAVDKANAIFQAGDYLKARGLLSELLKRAAEYGKESLDASVMLYYNLAVSEQALGNLDAAQWILLQGIEFVKKHYGENWYDLPTFYTTLGRIYYAKGQLEEALELYKKSRELNSLNYGPSDLSVACDLEDIASALLYLGRFEEAHKTFEKCLEIQLSQLEENSVPVARTYIFFAKLFKAQAMFHQALEKLGKAVQISSKVELPPPLVAMCLVSIGECLVGLGEFKQSLEFFNKALPIKIAQNGPDHPDVGLIRIFMGPPLYKIGKTEEGMKSILEGVEIIKKNYGEEHIDIAGGYNDLAILFKFQGRMNESIEYFQKALHLYTKFYGENSHMTFAVLSNLGVTYMEANKLDEAEKYFDQSIKIGKKIYGEISPNLATTYEARGKLFSLKQKPKESLEDYQTALNFYQKAYGPQDHNSLRVQKIIQESKGIH